MQSAYAPQANYHPYNVHHQVYSAGAPLQNISGSFSYSFFLKNCNMDEKLNVKPRGYAVIDNYHIFNASFFQATHTRLRRCRLPIRRRRFRSRAISLLIR